MSSRPSAVRVSATMRAGVSGKLSSARPRSSSSASSSRIRSWPDEYGSSRSDRGGQRVEAAADVGVQAHGDVVVDVDLGRKAVHVDDLGVAARVDADRIELLQFVAGGDDDVGLVEPEVHVVVAHEADGAERQRMVVGHHALAVERRRDRHAERLGEPSDRAERIAAGGAVAGEQHRIARRRAGSRRPARSAPPTDRRDAAR